MVAADGTADGSVPAGSSRLSRTNVLRIAREAVILGVLWFVYTLGRALAGKHIGPAFSNARDVWHFERWAHIPSEATLQRWTLKSDALVHVVDLYYKYVHLTDFVIICAWLLIFRPEHFRWFKRVIVFITGLELVGHFVYPLAPPRMNKQFGIVDTAQIYGNAVYGNTYENHGLFNQYAAMPSMHVGWSVFFAITIVSITKVWWRWIIVLHPIAMTYTVVVTGNHYWLDGIVGVTILAVGLVLFERDAPYAFRVRRSGGSTRATEATGGAAGR
jgi:hypothetical protein